MKGDILSVGLVPTLLLAVVLLQFSCATERKASSSAYTEDLSVNRPQFTTTEPTPVSKKSDTDALPITTIVPTKNVNHKVDVVLDSIDRINLTKRYVDGFTIQVYSGQRREEAVNAKQRLNSEVSDLSSSLQYIQPKFRVTVGSYITRIEAQKDFVRLKHHFSSAILVPEKIMIK